MPSRPRAAASWWTRWRSSPRLTSRCSVSERRRSAPAASSPRRRISAATLTGVSSTEGNRLLLLVVANVAEVDRLTVDAARGRSDPAREVAGLEHRVGHEAPHVRAVGLGRQPLVAAPRELLLGELVAGGIEEVPGEHPLPAVEAPRREHQLHARPPEPLVPAAERLLAVLDVGVAQHLVHRRAERDRLADELPGLVDVQLVAALERQMVLVALLLPRPALEARAEALRGVGRHLAAEEVERERVPEVQVLLDRRQVERAGRARLRTGAQALGGALDDAAHAALADEHVVRLLGEHEAAGARQRVEARLGEREQLVLAVAVGEGREHEEGEPVVDRLVEGAQDARLVGVAGAALEEGARLLAAVAAEVGVQEVDHRPEVAALLDVHLEEVAEVVERGGGGAQAPLLLDRGGLGG